ncbi:MAG: hypothetical protein ABI634_01705 [Acidobacteriota bacterium]
MRTHVRITAWLFLAFGVLLIAGAMFSTVLFSGLAFLIGASHEEGAPIGAAAMGFTGVVLTIVLIAFAVPSIACGWGLLKFKRWARLLGIVLAAIALLKFPVGTIFGVYALWVFFSKQTEPLFEGSAGSSAT